MSVFRYSLLDLIHLMAKGGVITCLVAIVLAVIFKIKGVDKNHRSIPKVLFISGLIMIIPIVIIFMILFVGYSKNTHLV